MDQCVQHSLPPPETLDYPSHFLPYKIPCPVGSRTLDFGRFSHIPCSPTARGPTHIDRFPPLWACRGICGTTGLKLVDLVCAGLGGLAGIDGYKRGRGEEEVVGSEG